MDQFFFPLYENQNCLKETKIVAVCTVHDVPSQNIEHEQKKSKFPDHWSLSHYFYQRNHNWLYRAKVGAEYIIALHFDPNQKESYVENSYYLQICLRFCFTGHCIVSFAFSDFAI